LVAGGELARNQEVAGVAIGDVFHLAGSTDIGYVLTEYDFHGSNLSYCARRIRAS